MKKPFQPTYFSLCYPSQKRGEKKLLEETRYFQKVLPNISFEGEQESQEFLPCPPEWITLCNRVEEIIQEERFTEESQFLGELQIPLLIGLANMGDFSQFELYNNLHNLPGRNISSEPLSDKETSTRDPISPAAPLITFGLDSIMLSPDQLKKENIVSLGSEYYLFGKRTPFDKRYMFFDGSIWHRYVALVDGWEESFRELLLEILTNYKNGVYPSIVAHEYLELQVRLLRNNFFGQIQGIENKDLGHRKRVVPFTYWSETEMKKRGNDLWKEIQEVQTNIQWYCYLVDDYTHKKLRAISSEKTFPSEEKFTKGTLILELANKAPKGQSPNQLIKIANLEGNRWTVNHLIEDLTDNSKVYDVIFLDFHLGEIEPEEKAPTIEYGYTLLERILNEPKLLKKANPFGKYWIFPISAFPFAFKTNVNARGDENFTQYWNLSDGGNPICTPEHFRMKLYKLLFAQLEQSYLDIKELVNVLRRIYYFQDPIKVRQKARENYNYFTALLANFYRIAEAKNTQREGFMVWRTIDKDILLLTHLEQFIRLTAFGIESASIKKQEKLSLVKRIVRESHPDEDLIDTLNNISI